VSGCDAGSWSVCDGGSDPDAGALDAGFDANDGLISCDPSAVTCGDMAPTCPMGFVPGVMGGCWDVCVQNVLCNRIACDEAAPLCPAGWGCVLGDCRPPR
jgi:hypothetical protein